MVFPRPAGLCGRVFVQQGPAAAAVATAVAVVLQEHGVLQEQQEEQAAVAAAAAAANFLQIFAKIVFFFCKDFLFFLGFQKQR